MRILIADDHDLLRDTLVAFLGAADGFEVGTAASFPEACKRIEEDDAYDLVLLDYRMPGMNGLDSLQEALALKGGQRVALISGEATREIAEQALDMGAAGFVPKTLPAKSLVNAVRFMAEGEVYAPVKFMTEVKEDEPHELAKVLTEREMQVLDGLCRGLSNKEIAREIDLQEVTVKLHVKTACRKLGAKNRTQAALAAKEAGLF